ncbi:MAG TPA: cupin domain-containing protein [Thermoanaerobaculia bacterium]|jgi:1,2-dihydroxy-3-keto-5-methylthiopentene dioxygenase|nr:cupin domain-containing protein [Thermoanaerobaculia bacterium]
MRAYRLEEPTSAIGPDELARRGVLSWNMPAEEAARAALLDAVKREHGYVDQDFVELKPEMENLEAICAKFDQEHYHTEDEVRMVVEGDGIFDVRDEGDQWIRIEVTRGDMIVIPARKYHRFLLTDRKHIRCMRLFANHEGWSPLYR